MAFRTEQTTTMPQTRNPRPSEGTRMDWPRASHTVFEGMSLCHLETGSKSRRIVPPPPPSGPVRKPLPYTPLRQNPTDIHRQESTIQRTKLVDWITVRLGSRVPSQDEEWDIQRAKGRRLHRDLRGFDEPTERKNEDPTLTPSEQLLQSSGGEGLVSRPTSRPLS
jgi:hypothetical protein